MNVNQKRSIGVPRNWNAVIRSSRGNGAHSPCGTRLGSGPPPVGGYPAEEAATGCSTLAPRRAFSLIELIGALTVIAILAAILLPSLIRQMDRIAGEQESAALRSLSDALQQSIMRKRYIPDASDWDTNIATELGVDLANVTINSRRQPRFFLIDPALRTGNNSSGLPYNQTNWVFGSVVTN